VKLGASLPCSHQSIIGSYSRPYQFLPPSHILFQHNPPVYDLVFQVGSYFQILCLKCMPFSSFPCLIHGPPIWSSLIWLYNNICWWVQIMKLLITQFSPSSCYFLSLRSKYSHSTLFLNTLNICSSLGVSDEITHPYKGTGKIMLL